MKKTVLAIRHLTSIDLGSLEEVLKQNNLTVRYFDTFKEDIRCVDPMEHDVVIVLGGIFGAYNQEEYPFLKDEISFLKQRIDADKPTLGICLGAQMIAAALGAEVYPGEQGFELGWAPLTLNAEAQNTPIRHFTPALTQMFFSHGDTFDLPEGATLLASSDMYKNQAYQYGQNILATQFHPEVDNNLVQEFLTMLVGQVTGHHPSANIHDIRTDTNRYIKALKTQTSKYVTEWLQKVL